MMISIIHPSRGRAEQAKKTCNNWIESAGKTPIQYILSLDADDPELNKYRGIVPSTLVSDNKNAVEAVNAAAKLVTGDIIVVISDDFDSPPKNWGDSIKEAAVEHKGVWAMKTDDVVQPWIITLPIVSIQWYKLFGYIYHPDYLHMFCDTDMTTVAELICGYIDARHIFIPHNHYTTGKHPKDALNERNDATWQQGQAVYLERFVNDFYLGQLKKNSLNVKNPAIAEHISWLVRMGVKNV